MHINLYRYVSGCCIRIVVSSRHSKAETYGRDTPVVTEPRQGA
jgi:hypothetical protein